jgi:cobalt-zinc-cadmium efflux system protein
LRESVTILLEVAPEDTDPAQIGRAMAAVPGVRNVHDLHIWTVTSGLVALAAHVVLAPGADSDAVLHTLAGLLARDYGITHTTLQLDQDHASGLLHIHRMGCPQAAPRSGPVTLAQQDHEDEP